MNPTVFLASCGLMYDLTLESLDMHSNICVIIGHLVNNTSLNCFTATFLHAIRPKAFGSNSSHGPRNTNCAAPSPLVGSRLNTAT